MTLGRTERHGNFARASFIFPFDRSSSILLPSISSHGYESASSQTIFYEFSFSFFFLFINTRFARTERIALESESVNSVSKGLAHRQFNGNDRVVL